MSESARDRATTVFFALSGVPAADRPARLDELCGGDGVVRAEVERLLGMLDAPEPDLPSHQGPRDATDVGVFQPAGTVIGDFVVLRQIGAGGTGVVHLAHQQHPPRVVALKVLRRELLASAARRRFEVEAELLAHLQHPGIAQVYAAHPGDETTPPYIAMELVSGPPITDYVQGRGLSIRDRVDLVAKVADAVQHAHQRGIIHRDLKPGNILVGDDGQPKVLDFGVARRLAQASPTTIATEAGQLVGTLAFMSPEQVQAVPEAIDTRTDIHALGVILFRLLTGRLPFGHGDPSLPELARRIVEEEATAIGTIDPALRGDLETIVARALAKEKERRYVSAAAFAADLRRYLDGQPISASADSAWYALRQRIGRYRAALATAAVAVVALAALAIYANVQRQRADRINAELEVQLSTSTVERGRLVSLSGNQPVAEELVWRELFRRPDSEHARWTLWEIYSREPSLWTHIQHETGTQTIRFSPDGTLLATAGRLDGVVQFVDVASGDTVRVLTPTPVSGLRRTLFTADGRTLVTGSEDGTLRAWDVATGLLQREIPKAMPTLHDLSISADGSVVSTVALGRAELWSMTTGERTADLSPLLTPVASTSVSPAGSLVAFGADDGTVTVIDLASRTVRWQARQHTGLVASVAFTPDGQGLASGGVEGDVHLWHPMTGRHERSFPSENGRVRNLAFDASGTKLAAAGLWRTRVWDLSDAAAPVRDVGASEGTTDVHMSADGRLLATCNGGSGQVRLWDLRPQPRTDSWGSHASPIRGVDVDAATGVIATAGYDGTVALRQAGAREPTRTLRSAGNVTAIDLSNNGRWLVATGTPGAAAVFDVATGRLLASLPRARTTRTGLFVDEDRQIVLGESNGTVVTWDWNGEVATIARERPGSYGEVLALSASGPLLAIAQTDHTISLYDVGSQQDLGQLDASSAPFSVAVSPDGRRLAAGTWLGAVDVWDVPSGRLLGSLKGQTAMVGGVDFSADGRVLAVASRDGTTRLWDVDRQQTLAIVASRRSGAERVRFLPGGRQLAIGYEDGVVELRDLDYFFRYAAGNATYQLQLFEKAGESFTRAGDVIAWSQRVLGTR